MTKSAIAKRARRGRLHRLHRGVYAVGHDGLSEEARWIAAVLASGTGAVLSHGAAAVHWGLLRPLDGPIDVTIPAQTGRARRQGIRIHRCESLKASWSTSGSPTRLVRRAIRQAEFLGLGLGEIKSDRTRSDLERDFLRLWRRTRLRDPEVNVPIGGMTVDFLGATRGWLSKPTATRPTGHDRL